VEEQEQATAALRVARELGSLERQVGVTLDEDLATEQRVQGIAVAVHNERVGFGDVREGRIALDFQEQRVVEAARPLQDCPAATAAAQHRDAEALAGIEIHFGAGLVRIAEYGEVLARLPEAKDFIGESLFAPVEERLVAREILLRSLQGSVQVFHGAWI